MLKDFLANVGMLVAFISICFQLFRNVGLNYKSPIRHRVLSGVIMGIMGCTLMLFSVQLNNNIIVDFRNLAVILSALKGGWLSAAISALIISIARIMISGISSPSIAAIIVLIAVAFTSSIISHSKIKYKFKWLFSVVISELMSVSALMLFIDNIQLRNSVILFYCISLSIISFLLYYYFLYSEALTASFRRYKSEAKRDFLTGLNNVRQFDSLYNEVIENVKIKHEMTSLLFIDIDFFKKVNDTYGHKEGDLVLKKLSEILMQNSRNIDIVSRNGGEEFSVILIGCTASLAIEIAERIRKAIEAAPIKLSNGSTITITVSIGISSYPDPVEDLDLLIEKADEALYEAKRTGRNKVVLYKQK